MLNPEPAPYIAIPVNQLALILFRSHVVNEQITFGSRYFIMQYQIQRAPRIFQLALLEYYSCQDQ